MDGTPGEVTKLLLAFGRRESQAADHLFPLIYRELRRLAGGYMRGERRNHSLQATALVHEVYLRLVDQDRADWKNRAQFFGVAAQMMRRVLVDHARNRGAAKRRGSKMHVHIAVAVVGAAPEQSEEILTVDTALQRLSEFAPRQSRIIELRYFGGLTIEEAAAALDLSLSTVKREWKIAKAWLQAELEEVGADDT